MDVDDLKAAVAKALEDVRDLKTTLSGVEADVDERMEALAEIDQKREASARHVAEACTKLEETAKRGHDEMHAASEAAAHALQAAKAELVKECEQAQGDLGHAQQETATLHTHVDEADAEIKTKLAEVEKDVHDLTAQAASLKADLARAVQAADQLLNEEAAELQRLMQAVAAETDKLQALLKDECAVPIAEDEQTESRRTEDVLRAVEESFGVAASHATDVATHCIQEREHVLSGVFTDLASAGAHVSQALDTLKEKTGNARQTALGAADRLDQALERASSSVDSAIDTVHTVLNVIEAVGFVL